MSDTPRAETLSHANATPPTSPGSSPPVGTIAGYEAEMKALEARWQQHCERERRACLDAAATGTEPDLPRDYGPRQYEADREACEAKHFPRIDPRTGAGLTTPARLWRWIMHRLGHVEMMHELEAVQGTGWAEMNPMPYRAALKVVYEKMHKLDLPGAPDQP